MPDEIFNEVQILPNAPFNYFIFEELVKYLVLIVDVWLAYCNYFKLALCAALLGAKIIGEVQQAFLPI